MRKGKWKDSSGKIQNPGKYYFLQLAVRFIRELNEHRDPDGINFSIKTILSTGLALNVNGQWKVQQLTPKLKRIVQKHKNVFDCT